MAQQRDPPLDANGAHDLHVSPNLMPTREWLKKLKGRSPFVTKILDQPKLFVFGTEDELRALK